MSIRFHLVSQSNNKLISNNEQLFNVMNLPPVICHIIYLQMYVVRTQQILKLIQELQMRKKSKVCTVKILLDSGASASNELNEILHERYKILKDKNIKWSNMTGILNTTFVREIILNSRNQNT